MFKRNELLPPTLIYQLHYFIYNSFLINGFLISIVFHYKTKHTRNVFITKKYVHETKCLIHNAYNSFKNTTLLQINDYKNNKI